MPYKKLISFIFILCFVLVSQAFSQQNAVTGKYAGFADAPPFGKLNVTAEIREKEGKLSGVLHTPLGDAGIIEGSILEGKLRLKVDSGGDDLILEGVRSADGKLTGTISGQIAQGSFELNRVGDLEPEKDYSVVLQQSKEKWQEDLSFLAKELPLRHKDAFNRISKNEFEKLVADLDRSIPVLTDDEIIWGMARIVSKIGDGHTSLRVSGLYSRIPVSLFWFGKELRVVRVSEAYPRLNDAKLVKINGVPIERIYERSRDYIPQGESEQFTLNASQNLLRYPVFLNVIGVSKDADKAVYEFIDAAGKSFKQELKSISQDQKIKWLFPYKTTPLYLQNEDQPLSFSYLKEDKTVYVNFRSYPRRPEFTRFSKELFDFIDKNPVKKLVFDLRQNGGGDFTRGRDFFIKPLKERPNLTVYGRLFVLTGRQTFSAGMSNAADFKNDFKAILVGEPTGARPNGYQENRGFILPNSHINLSYSTELYKFSQTDTPGILPDERIDPDWASYKAGIDPTLKWALEFKTRILLNLLKQ